MSPDALQLLWPRPRHIEIGGNPARCSRFLKITCADFTGLDAVFARTRARAQRAGCASTNEPAPSGELRIARAPEIVAEGYRLRVADGRAEALASDAAGARHALATFAQVLELCAGDVPELLIDDAPDIAERGVMLDVSRGRIPTMATLCDIAGRLADLKINRLQLYCEHAFAYVGHADVWRDASPIQPDEMLAFAHFCADLGIELVPNQQSFGHMHRWLKHARYRDLAEVPEGVEHAFSLDREPYSLNLGDPRALALLGDLYDQLCACTPGRSLNVGLDETFDLGLGRSKSACAERGVERVYLEYLAKVHALVSARGRRMQFWGDVILQRPELVPELPRDLVALEWGYEAGHPFAQHVEHFRASGLEFHVCPGTSSWQSFAGRTHNMLANVRSAAVEARRAGARGFLTTDWGDRGHHQPSYVRAGGIVAGAGLAWNVDAAGTLDAKLLAALLDAHVFKDRSADLGRTAVALGDVDRATGSPATNGSALFFLIAFAPDQFPHPRTPDLTVEGLQRAKSAITDVVTQLAGASAVHDEIRWAADACTLGADLGLARLAAGSGVPLDALAPRVRHEFASRFDALGARHTELWLRHDRPGGLSESLRWFERVTRALRTS